MVIIFQSEKPRRFLLKNGVVFTFRLHRREPVGRDWMTDKRGGRKIADVEVEEVGYFNSLDLDPYVAYSGFSSVEEWNEEIKRILKWDKLPPKRWQGWLYEVSLGLGGIPIPPSKRRLQKKGDLDES